MLQLLQAEPQGEVLREGEEAPLTRDQHHRDRQISALFREGFEVATYKVIAVSDESEQSLFSDKSWSR